MGYGFSLLEMNLSIYFLSFSKSIFDKMIMPKRYFDHFIYDGHISPIIVDRNIWPNGFDENISTRHFDGSILPNISNETIWSNICWRKHCWSNMYVGNIWLNIQGGNIWPTISDEDIWPNIYDENDKILFHDNISTKNYDEDILTTYFRWIYIWSKTITENIVDQIFMAGIFDKRMSDSNIVRKLFWQEYRRSNIS